MTYYKAMKKSKDVRRQERRKGIAMMLDYGRMLKLVHKLGFTLLVMINVQWIRKFVLAKEDYTLQAHRGSYKTTCLQIAIAFIMILEPHKNIIFLRKTDDGVMEVVRGVLRILQHPIMVAICEMIHGIPLEIVKENATEISTNLYVGAKGAVQLFGVGIKGSLTGKHADIVITDDIVTLKDRVSRAEREYTKQIYQELQNIKNRGGRILNTGTTWHKDDCFELMPEAVKWNCYQAGLMSKEEIEGLRKVMTPSLFAANYELLHIASENALFAEPPKFVNAEILKQYNVEDESELLRDGLSHIDAGYDGDDGSAMTLIKKHGDVMFVLGKVRKRHIDDCLDDYLKLVEHYKCGKIKTEKNADKGYLAKEIKRRGGNPDIPYHENMNKHLKISTHLKRWWTSLVFLEETDPEYIQEIQDYTEDAGFDDCPDSLASILRTIGKPERKPLYK